MDVHDSDAFLRFLAARNAYIWEVVGGGPLGPLGPLGRLDAVALNPKPLPPAEIGAALVAVLAERAAVGGSYARFVEEVDDWCGTGWPHHIPVPKPHGPSPWELFLGAAVAATQLAHGLEGTDAKQVGGAAQRLFEQAQQFAA